MKLYIFWFLHQTTTKLNSVENDAVLYIFWFLHQTTTLLGYGNFPERCISFDSYIKPQQRFGSYREHKGCISFDSYIKPQLFEPFYFSFAVVYLLIPTSNHNITSSSYCEPLVVYLLIPTSNHNELDSIGMQQTVVYLLIPTSNHNFINSATADSQLYIFWFLHQTTTFNSWYAELDGCISFDSYIKPQRVAQANLQTVVVYLLIPTSNHNLNSIALKLDRLYIFWFLHQTTTLRTLRH